MFRDQTIATWVSDFGETAAYGELPAPAKEYAEEILGAFLRRACEERDTEPGDLGEADVKPALLETVAGLDVPASARAAAPDLCAAFVAELEAQGRLAGGRALARYMRALKGAFEERTSAKPVRNPGPRIGRNAPCPCGSGRKFKNCCMRR